MNKIADILAGGIVKDVMGGLGDLFTSDDERLKARNILVGIQAKIQENVNSMVKFVEQSVTDRHASDMNSDSWLSKNVRPLTLIIMTIVTILFIVLDNPITDIELESFKVKLSLLTTLDVTVFGFYFGSRGLEKVASKIAEAFPKKAKKKQPVDEDWDYDS